MYVMPRPPHIVHIRVRIRSALPDLLPRAVVQPGPDAVEEGHRYAAVQV